MKNDFWRDSEEERTLIKNVNISVLVSIEYDSEKNDVLSAKIHLRKV